MSREHLDISIENLDKVPNKLALHIGDVVTVSEKVDGTKLTIIRNHEPWNADATKNWIVSYKSNLINPEDFHGLQSKHNAEISDHSTGISQYKFVWDGLKKNHAKTHNIPAGTELFIEFVMRKATLTRQYESYHAMILIASSATRFIIQSGKVYSTPETFDVSHNAEYAKMLGIQTAKVLYQGPLKKIVNAVSPVEMVAELKSRFLGMPSQFGGKMEGVVLEFPRGEIYKLVQDDQYDKAVRGANKSAFEPHDAAAYWASVRGKAEAHFSSIDPTQDYKQNVSALSHAVYGGADLNLDGNKKSINAKDDVFLTAKNMLMRATPGNNGALFLGRMSPITIAHHKIIADALSKYDTVSVNLVKAKVDAKNPFPVELQKKMLELCFGNKIEILIGTTGNLSTILQKSKHMINVVLAGTDRVEGYTDQLKRNPDMKVVEIPRTDGVSATLVRGLIAEGNVAGFQKYTPSAIWPLFEELRKHIQATR